MSDRQDELNTLLIAYLTRVMFDLLALEEYLEKHHGLDVQAWHQHRDRARQEMKKAGDEATAEAALLKLLERAKGPAH